MDHGTSDFDFGFLNDEQIRAGWPRILHVRLSDGRARRNERNASHKPESSHIFVSQAIPCPSPVHDIPVARVLIRSSHWIYLHATTPARVRSGETAASITKNSWRYPNLLHH